MFIKGKIEEQAKSLKLQSQERFTKVLQTDIINAVDYINDRLMDSESVWAAINECIEQCLDEIQKEKENKKITRVYRGRIKNA